MEINFAREQSYRTPVQNSTLLPLLLMTLANQLHTPIPSSGFKPHYDYIIIGAGTAGSVVASRLSEEECVSVLVLEAGKTPPLLSEVPQLNTAFFDSDIDWAYRTVPQKYTARAMNNRQVLWPSGKAIGGSSILNAMVCIRGNRCNYDEWERRGSKGWGWRDVLPYFKKAEDNTDPDIASNGCHGVYGPLTIGRFPAFFKLTQPFVQTQRNMGIPFGDPNCRGQLGVADFQGNIRGNRRCSTAKAYLVPTQHRRNIDILSEAFVTKILIEGNRAYGVEFYWKGTIHRVRADREVILSAGTVNSAQLLMVSGIGPRRTLERFGIDVIVDLPVGMNFQDHVGSVTLYEVLEGSNIPSLREKLLNERSIWKYINNKPSIYSASESTFGISFLKSERSYSPPCEPDYELYGIEKDLAEAKSQWGVNDTVYDLFMRPYENATIVSCYVQAVRQRSPGIVTIQSANAFKPPVIDPQYLKDPRDMGDLVSGLKMCNRIFTSPEMLHLGVRPIKTIMPGCEHLVHNEEEYLQCIAESIAFTLSHQVGTAKMGEPADPTTVVDPELRVKGIIGLRVVDASVMPTVPNTNTHCPVVMIGEKASYLIKQHIYC